MKSSKFIDAKRTEQLFSDYGDLWHEPLTGKCEENSK